MMRNLNRTREKCADRVKQQYIRYFVPKGGISRNKVNTFKLIIILKRFLIRECLKNVSGPSIFF